jgi:hypothetical protein
MNCCKHAFSNSSKAIPARKETMPRIRDHNGARQRWTRTGWKASKRPAKLLHWSEAYPAGLISGIDANNPPEAPEEPLDSGAGEGSAAAEGTIKPR